MDSQSCELYSRQYAQYVAKEAVKASAGKIFDDLRAAFKAGMEAAPQDAQALRRALDLLSDVECRYYNEFDIQAVFEEILEH